MRFLFLDDDPQRHLAFGKMTVGVASVIHVVDVEECKAALLENEPFDCVFLDHDLGGKVFVKEIEGTGTEVAEFIRNELPQNKYPKNVVIHSWNPDGAIRMEKIISSTGIPVRRKPFSR